MTVAADPRSAAEAILSALECGQSRCRCAYATRRGHGKTHCPVHADNTPSFGVDVKNEHLLLHCYGGCGQETVVADLRGRNLWPENARYVNDTNDGRIEIAAYDYRDAENTLLYQAVRYFPKTFRQRKPQAGSGNRWTWNIDGCPRVLYRLPDLLAADPTRLRFILEGEKDVDRAWAAGLVATTNVMGAGKWRDEYAEYFRGLRVVIVADNDQPGADHVRDIARSLMGIAAEIRILELPGIDEHGDLSDWFDDGGTREQLQVLVKGALHADVPAKRPPEATVTADEILYAWPEEGIQCCFSRLRETDSGQVRGHIEIRSSRPNRVGDGLVLWQYINLAGASDKDRITKRLLKAAPRDEDIWLHDVEVCFQEVSRLHLTVPPPHAMADMEEPTGTGYLFRPIAPRGQVCEFLADQGTTKSYLVLYLLACTAIGRESIFGMPGVIGPSIYFDWEVDEETARRRLGWILRGMGVSTVPPNLYYVNMSDRGKLIDRVRDMRHQIATTGAVAVGIDSLTFAVGGDLNQTEMSAPTMAAIGSLGVGVTKLICTHPPKSTRKEPGDVSAIGSAVFEFRARGIWHMQRPREYAPSFVVSMTQNKQSDDEGHPPIFYRVSFDKSRRAVSFAMATADDEPELAERVLSARAQIERYLRRKTDHQANVSQIARETGIKLDTVRRTCNRMGESDGPLLRLSGDGNTTVWSLREPPLEVPTNGHSHMTAEDHRDTEPYVPDLSRDSPATSVYEPEPTSDPTDLPW